MFGPRIKVRKLVRAAGHESRIVPPMQLITNLTFSQD